MMLLKRNLPKVEVVQTRRSAIVCGGSGLFRVKSVAVVKVRMAEIVGGGDWWCDGYGFLGAMVIHGAKKWWSWFMCCGGGDWRCTGALQCQETPGDLTTGDHLSPKVNMFLIPVIGRFKNAKVANVVEEQNHVSNNDRKDVKGYKGCKRVGFCQYFLKLSQQIIKSSKVSSISFAADIGVLEEANGNTDMVEKISQETPGDLTTRDRLSPKVMMFLIPIIVSHSHTAILAFLQSITALAVAENPLPTNKGKEVPSANPMTSLVSSNNPILSFLKRFVGIKFTHDPKSAKEVIENGSTLLKTTVVEGVEKVTPITFAEDKAQRRLEVKARSTLMTGSLGFSKQGDLKQSNNKVSGFVFLDVIKKEAGVFNNKDFWVLEIHLKLFHWSLFKWAKRQTWYKACDEVYSLNECRDLDKHMLMADLGEFIVEAELDQEGKLSMLFMELFLKVELLLLLKQSTIAVVDFTVASIIGNENRKLSQQFVLGSVRLSYNLFLKLLVSDISISAAVLLALNAVTTARASMNYYC
ncbi:hypothetical protein Tco_1079346 [Tanacetum coccineum]|uniref:Uncharacterized protein n=1 Tax=Tanacetum coccineum TaxID=301880 RepID=A0ABQ5HRJ0_9ASTR